MSDWHDRYRNGHEAQVWKELTGLDVRDATSAQLDDARLVCDEMARRARHNVVTLVARLGEQGYRFHHNDDAQTPVVPHLDPGSEVEPILSWLDDALGPVPLTLASWMRIVGDVWLVGTHPQWFESEAADPLVVQAEGGHYPSSSMLEHYRDELAWFTSEVGEPADAPAGGFTLPLAPDWYHKANISGGEPYGVRLPCPTVDAVFTSEVDEPFVAYLDRVFAHGGFGRVEGVEGRTVSTSLAHGLLRL